MNGFAWGVLAVLVLALLAFHRPILARIGFSQAFQRPRQTGVIAVGLMFATVVLGASAIAADSTRKSFQEAIIDRAPGADVVASSWEESRTWPVKDLERLKDIGFLSGHVVQQAVALRWELPLDNQQSQLGDDRITVYGIDPAAWVGVTGMTAVEGDLPATLAAWPKNGIILNQVLADQLDTNVGDDMTGYILPHLVDDFNRTQRTGRLVLTVAHPSGSGYVHSPQDQYQFTFDSLEDAKRVEIGLDTNANANLHLFVRTGNLTFRNLTGGAHPRLVFPEHSAFLAGPYQVTVESPQAADVAFTAFINITFERETEVEEFPNRVVAIASNAGSDPVDLGAAAFLPLPRLQALLAQAERANTVLMKTDGTVSFHSYSDEAQSLQREGQKILKSWIDFNSPKSDLERMAAEIDLGTRAFFLGLGSFTLAAGFMLIVVLLGLLVEERKGMLAALRAVGAQRRDLTRLHLHEGAVYAALAAFAGLLGAAALVAWLGRVAKDILAEEEVPFRIFYEPATLLSVLGFGFVLTLLAIAAAAHKATAIDVAAALRHEESERRGRRRWPAYLVLATGLLATLSGLLTGELLGRVLGPVLLAFGVAAVLGRWVNRNVTISLAALGVLAYTTWTFWTIPIDSETSAILVPVRGVILAVSGAVFVAYSAWFHHVLARLVGQIRRVGPLVETALSHMRRRPGRAALTIAMVATVLTVMTALGTMFASARPIELGATGGYSVFGSTDVVFEDAREYYAANPPRSGVDPFKSIDRMVTVPLLHHGLGDFELQSDNQTFVSNRAYQYGHGILLITPDLVNSFAFEAKALAPGYASLTDALQAVASQPGLLVLSEGAQVYHFGTGENDFGRYEKLSVGALLVTDEGKPPWRVVGLVKGLGTAGGFAHPLLGEESFRRQGTRIYAEPVSGVADVQLARQLEAGFRRAALDAVAVSEATGSDQAVFHAMQTLLGVFLGLGIVVGLVSVGLVTARNVVVRRREVGMFRAVGAQQSQILLLFSVESLYITIMAILIGLGVGLVLATSFLREESFLAFTIDWGALGVLYLVTLAAAVLTALVPALKAARSPPAEAVRYVE